MSATETEPETPVQAEDPVAEATKGVDELFEWCQWVHVGPHADECEERWTGRCEREEHFHAWVRLANPFQIRDIAEKARAARARRTRALKDPESDAHVILEVELDDLRTDDAREVMIQQIVDTEGMDDFERAVRELETREEYEGIQQHQEELARQLALPEIERDEETVEQAQKIIDEYRAELEREIESIRAPRIDVLKDRTTEELVNLIRQDRIKASADEAYLHTYNYWQWYVGTLKGACDNAGKPTQPHQRMFGSISELKSAPTSVIHAIHSAFNHLEVVQARGRAAGNA